MSGPASRPFVHGVRTALAGLRFALGNRPLRRTYVKLALVLFGLTVALDVAGFWGLFALTDFGGDGSAWMAILAIVLRVLGGLVVLMLAPLVAIVVINLLFPLFNEGVFLAAMRQVDPERAERLAAMKGMPIAPAMGISAWRLVLLVVFAVLLFAVQFVPVAGNIVGTLGGLWLGARTAGWELLDPYFGRLDVRFGDQRVYFRAHRRVLLGFGLPMAVLLAVPLVGPLFFGVAQAAVVELIVHGGLPAHPKELELAGAGRAS